VVGVGEKGGRVAPLRRGEHSASTASVDGPSFDLGAARRRGTAVPARVACPAWSSGPSTSPLDGPSMPSFGRIRELWRNTEQMPWLMRMLCQGGMVAGPFLALFTLVPGVVWNVNGRPMTYHEVWSSGVGAAIFVSMLLLTVGTWGAAARAPNSRWAIVLFPVPMSSISLIHDVPNSSPASVLSSAGITALVLYFCLFHLDPVRRYFDEGPSKHRWRGP
jgi:hypothetical protein